MFDYRAGLSSCFVGFGPSIVHLPKCSPQFIFNRAEGINVYGSCAFPRKSAETATFKRSFKAFRRGKLSTSE